MNLFSRLARSIKRSRRKRRLDDAKVPNANHLRSLRAIDAELLEDRVLFNAAPIDLEALQAADTVDNSAEVIDALNALTESINSLSLFADIPAAPGTEVVNADGVDADSLEDGLVASVENEALGGVQTTEPVESREIVFIDRSVDDYETLVSDLRSSSRADRFDVVFVGASEDGIEKITSALAERGDYDAIHIVSHGNDRGIRIGETWLSGSTLQHFQNDIASWGESLAESGSIRFHHPNLAETSVGRALLDSVGELCDCPVSAVADSDWQPSSIDEHPAQFVESVNSTELRPSSAVEDQSQHNGRDAPASSLVLIDSQLDDVDILATAVKPDSSILYFDSRHESADGVLTRVVDWAEERGTVFDSISVLAHGSSGGFLLGNEWITADSLAATASQWQRLDDVLVDGGNIFLMGCNLVGPDGQGQQLLDALSELTGGDVFGSDDLTGTQGDWVLEASSAGAASELASGLTLPLDEQILRATNVSLAWYDPNWLYRKAITIDHTQVSGGDQTNFPVLINLAADGDLATAAQADGDDILFTSADGSTQLDHEIEVFNSGTGELVAWVRVPTLSSSADTVLYVYYGNASASNQENPGGVWTASYEGVWHLSEAPSDGTSNSHIDSTSTSNHGTPYNFQDGSGPGTTNATGKIGGADFFDKTPSANDVIDVAHSANLNPSGDLTVEAWLYANQSGVTHFILQKDHSAAPWFSYQLYAQADGAIAFGWANSGGSQFYAYTAAGTVTSGNWYHIAAVKSGTSMSIFVDGADATTSSAAAGGTVFPATQNLSFGDNGNGFSPNGILDEMRVSSIARSASWIATEHNNQDSPGTFFSLASQEGSNIVEVDTTSDVADGDTSSITALYGNKGADGFISLREAIIATNNTTNGASADEIHFAIGGGGQQTIAPTAQLPTIDDAVFIDGRTQGGFGGTPLIEIDGQGVVPVVNAGLLIDTSNSTIHSLSIVGWNDDGLQIQSGNSGNFILGNYIGLRPDGTTILANADNGIDINGNGNTVGGIAAGERNVISGNAKDGIEFETASAIGNTVIGNYIGTDATGTAAKPNRAGVRITGGANGNTIGGTTPAERNVISGNTDEGIWIDDPGSDNNVIRGNFIGVNKDGDTALGNGQDGVYIENEAQGNIIGGTAAGSENVISGNTASGVRITDLNSEGNQILGNFIGTDLGGTIDLGNMASGVRVENDADNNFIGAPITDGGNTIAFNDQDGVRILDSDNDGNAIRANSIFSNDQQGIDLATDGVTSNDINDVDTGSNQEQNFPVLSAATESGGDTTITGSLNSLSGTTFAIDFFSSPSGDEGQVYLGSDNVTTVGNDATINTTLVGVSVTAGHVVTATATDPSGNTSEFSAPVVATSGTTISGTVYSDEGTTALGNQTVRIAINGVDFGTTAESNATTGAYSIGGLTLSGGDVLTIYLEDETANAVTVTVSDGNSLANIDLYQDYLITRQDNGGSLTNTNLNTALVVGEFDIGDIYALFSGNLVMSTSSELLIPTGHTFAPGSNVTAHHLDIDGTFNATGSQVFINGDWDNASGTATLDQTVTFWGSGDFSLITGGTGTGNDFQNLVINKATGSVTLVGSSLDVDGIFTLSSGTFTQSAGLTIAVGTDFVATGGVFSGGDSLIDVDGHMQLNNGTFTSTSGQLLAGGNWTNSGATFNSNSGTVVLDGTSQQVGGSTTFYNLTKTVAATDTLTFASGSTQTIANGGSVTLNGASGQLLTLAASAAGDWLLDVDAGATQSISYVDVSKSDASGGSQVIANDGTNNDGGGNTNWLFGPTTITVNTTADENDGDTSSIAALVASPGGTGISLREAITAANNTANVIGPDEIHFNIAGAGPHTINMSSALPDITDAVLIDGWSEPDYVAGTPVVELNGTSAGGGSDGFKLWAGSSGSTIRGLIINRFDGDGIDIDGASSGNTIVGNWIGLDNTGLLAQGNNDDGLEVSSDNNVIGGTTLAERNVISGSGTMGIVFAGANSNTVRGNYIGTDAAGGTDLGNAVHGISISGGGSNTIGGTTAAERNVISGNNSHGIGLQSSTANNAIQGNYIGTNAAGNAALGNSDYGVAIGTSSNNNTIGGSTAGARNIISGNTVGVDIMGVGTTANQISGNYIGLNVGGMAAIANTNAAINIGSSAHGNTIGGTTTGHRNVIAGAAIDGIRINSANNTQILNNYIGTNAAGDADLGFNQEGIEINNADGTVIGASGQGNLISGNDGAGIGLQTGAANTVIQGNLIGTDAAGTASLANSLDGIQIILTASGTTIGGTGAGEGNTIAFNGADGVMISSSGTGNSIQGNLIHSNTQLGIDLGNDGVTANDVGDVDTGANNLQNFPAISWAATDGGTTAIVDGSINSTASTTFRVELFASASADTSGFGEAERYLGFVNVTTDGSGNANFRQKLATSVSGGEVITATATDPSGNTSEFSSAVSAVSAARTATGLTVLYDFEEGSGSTVNDVSGFGAPLDLTVANLANTTWVAGGLSIDTATILSSGVAASKVYTAAQVSNEITMEAWVAPANVTQGGPARIITSSVDIGNRNWMLGQAADEYVSRLRTSTTSGNGDPDFVTTTNEVALALQHLVYTRTAAGVGTLYVDGVEVATETRLGDFSNWDAGYQLHLANEQTLDRPWLGEYYLAAVYDRALTAEEVAGNFLAGEAITVNTVTVDTTSDVADGDTSSIAALIGNKGADGFISLREAITAANNTTNAATPDEIHFNIAGAGPHTINVTSILPRIDDAVVIDGWTEPDYAAGAPVVELNGAGAGAVDGLRLGTGSSGTTIRGLIINRFGEDGIDIASDSTGNTIAGNWIGLSNTGTSDQGNGNDGIELSSSGNTIGGTTLAERNVISGNNGRGISVFDPTATGNTIIGNYIGTNAAGNAAVGNTDDGIGLTTNASNNTIGGMTAAEHNVISGNNSSGIYINGSSATGNVIRGNYIGTDASGLADVGNANYGIRITGGANANTVGTGNVIAGNDNDGIQIDGTGSDNNIVRGNLIGVDATGLTALANDDDGVEISDGAQNNIVGGTVANERNILSGNTDDGLQINDAGSTGNVVQGNYIGLGSDGVTAVANASDGIELHSAATGNMIGGTMAGAGNRIAFNSSRGIRVVDPATAGNSLLGNQIYSNSGIGIDLEGDDVTTNDAGDGDSGSNNLQNFPLLTSALTNAADSVTIVGTFNSSASTTYRIEFFASATADPSGNGEGERYLGFQTVTTNSSGNAVVGAVFSETVAAGEFISATATVDLGGGNYGDTSEFASNIAAAFNAISPNNNSSANTTGASSLSWSHEVLSGNDRVLIVGFSVEDSGDTVTSVTYGGTPLSLVGRSSGAQSVEIWELIAPAVGTANIVANFSGVAQVVGGAASFNGTNQTDPTGTFQSNSGSSSTPTLNVTAAAGDLVIDTVTVNDSPSTITVGADQFVHWNDLTGTGGGRIRGAGSTQAGAVSVPMSWTLSSSVQWEIAAVPLKPAVMNTLTVDTTSDVADGDTSSIINLIATPGADGFISLREAITATNNTANGGSPDSIHFNIAGAGPHSINLISALPDITEAVIIDGTTEPDYAGTPVIELNGAGAGSTSGLVLSGAGSSGSEISGLAINRFSLHGIETFNSDNNTIISNYIGTDVTGTIDLGNTLYGIQLGGGTGNVVGQPGAGNLLSANGFAGLYLVNTSNAVVESNKIGTDAAGTSSLGNGFGGIYATSTSTNNTIGGTGAGEGNLIAFNTGNGILLGDGSGNSLLGNSIHSNSGLGIGLGLDGVTLNDSGDPDSGANNLQNFPVLTNLAWSPTSVTIDGTLNSAASTTYRIEFFANSTGDPSGYGEGQTYLGFSDVTTDGSGNAVFSVPLAVSVAAGNSFTATATDPSGNTSEFSAETGGLVAHYDLDEGSGTIAFDSSGRGNDGAHVNSPSYTSGISGTGLDFSGGLSLVDAGDPADGSLDFDAGDFSISVWVNTSTSPGAGVYSAIIDKRHFAPSTDGYELEIDGTTDTLYFQIWDSGSNFNVSGGNILDGQWHHLVGVKTATQIELFVDGVSQGTAAHTLGSIANTDALTFGNRDSGNANTDYEGLIDEISLYNRALTTSEINDLYTSPLSIVTVDTTSDAADGDTSSITNLLSNRGADGFISLREAITATNNTANGATPDEIHFNIAGTGPHTISVLSALPTITDSVVIDGWSEPDFGSTPIIELNGTSAGSTVGLSVNAANTTIRGLVINRFNGDGIGINANNATVYGTYIGTDTAGTSALANTDDGIAIASSSGHQIGGTGTNESNIIAASGGQGVRIDGAASTGIVIQGNFIGTDLAGTVDLGNSAQGIFLTGGANGNTIGGTSAGAGNTIAFNTGRGIRADSGTGNAFRGNAIYSNGDIGIDIDAAGVDANDAGDGDTGANNVQNFPVLSSVVSAGGNTTILGTFNSTSGTTFAIDFYSSPTGDASGNGEGAVYLGSDSVTTDGSGNATINTTLVGVSVTNGHAVSATATDPSNNTSEFAANISAVAPTTPNSAPTFSRFDGLNIHNISSAADGAVSVRTADLDLDGDLDVLSAWRNGDTFAWHENDGSQNFTLRTITTTANGAYSVWPVDLDQDGDVDVATASRLDNTVAWYENDGSQNFTLRTITTNADGANHVHVIDLDQDGDLDVLSSSEDDGTIAWYENDGSQNFTKIDITNAADRPYWVMTEDVDQDGDLDVLSASFNDDTLAWYENDGSQNFTQRIITNSADGAGTLATADMDDDGDIDVLLASQLDDTLAWYENDGSQSFTQRIITSAADGAWAVAVADVDADGDLDAILGAYEAGTVTWYENDGSESFTERTIATGLVNVQSVTSADLDGDGNLDILSAARISDSVDWFEQIRVTTLDANPTFVEGGPAVVLDADVDIVDAELNQLNGGSGNYSGASATLIRDSGADANDLFAFNNGNGITLSGGNLIKNSQIIATFDTTTTPGELTIDFTDANGELPTSSDVDNILRQITYANASASPPPSVQIDWTFDDGNTGGQGTGGALQALGSTTVTLLDADHQVDVTTTSDVSDGDTSSIAALKLDRGADGFISLREAITATNNTANGGSPDEIHFEIAAPLIGGAHTINVSAAGLPVITEAVIIDGTTDSDFAGTPIIELNGAATGGGIDGLYLDSGSGGSMVRGLVINRFGRDAIQIWNGAGNITIVGNYLGTDVTGTSDLGNGGAGIRTSSNSTTIGGATLADRNVIAANGANGIQFANGSSNNVVQGNLIGIGVGGEVLGNNTGIYFGNGGTSGTLVGGTGSGEANTIAYSISGNIRTSAASGNNNALVGNSIFGSGGLGIDLEADGVTNNDVDDGDSGPNALLNFPVLTHVAQNGADLDIDFAVDLPAGNYRIEFFENPTDVNSLGMGEGQTLLGAVTITTTGAAGYETFTRTLTGVTPTQIAGMSATAIVDLGGGNYGSTSEFGPRFAGLGVLTVTTTDDTLDGDTSSILNLLGNRGADGLISLREAITAANNTANGAAPDEIHFSIAGTGPHTIQPTSALPNITEGVVIDGTTEPDFAGTPVVEIDGSLAGATIDGLTLATGSGGSTIRGLVLNRFGGDGIQIDAGSDGNTIAGNFVGIDVAGTTAVGNTGDGIRSLSDNNLIGGLTAADRNIISGNTNGITLGGTGSVVVGNYVGTDATGTADLGNSTSGLHIGASNHTIGGDTATERNIIAGNNYAGIRLVSGSSTGNHVQGNYIGTDVTGTLALGSSFGIVFDNGSNNNLIGGTAAGEGNLIANNVFGVKVAAGVGSTTDNAILGNSVFSNGLGIDIGSSNGITYNDAEDVDSGPNDLLNFPVLTNVFQNGADLDIDLAVDLPAGNYRIEFFDNPSGLDASGFGEGETHIGFASITVTGAAGYESFSITLTSVTASDVLNITVTATEDLGGGSYGSTSEFGPQFLGTGVLVVDTTSDVSDGDTSSIAALFGNRGADGFISLREAITAANNTANGGSPDEIQFNIAGVGPHTIQPTSSLPDITDAVVIDGWSEPDFAGTPIIELEGSLAGINGDGLRLINAGSSGSTIRGLVINKFLRDGIVVDQSDNNSIVGNYLGVGTDGSTLAGNFRGIFVNNGDNNTIGGTTVTDRNVISGNFNEGIFFAFGSTANTIQGNYIGLASDGTTAVGNLSAGIALGGADNNVIGGAAAGAGNVISSNTGAGIDLNASDNNFVTGNYIGTDAAGSLDRVNGAAGIFVHNGAANNAIGGSTAAARNVVSTIQIEDVATSGNYVQGNYIGLNAAGTAGIGSIGTRINIIDSPNNIIGTDGDGVNDATEGNVVASASIALVAIQNGTATGNVVAGNLLGTDAAGTSGIGSSNLGVWIVDASNNRIGTNADGTSDALERNVISDNGRGVLIQASLSGTASGNVVAGNYIGTDITGTSALPNVEHGVWILEASGGTADNNIIGGSVAAAANVIAFNNGDGIRIEGGGVGNRIQRNSIYSNALLGIDLNADGVSANDPGDGDTNANNSQNFPDLVSAASSGGDTTILGALNSTASTTFELHFYSSPTADGSGFGEGEVYLGTDSVTTDGSGNATINTTLVGTSVTTGHVITATAIDPAGNTSEFSMAVSVAAPNPVLDLDADDSSGQVGADFSVAWTEDGPPVNIADTDATLFDPDSPTLSSLTITITNLLDGAAELLSASTGGTAISASYDSPTGVLTLTGIDTVTNYQQVLRSVTYDNMLQDPNTTDRVITLVANDGTNNSNAGTTTITLNELNDAPVVSGPGVALNTTEQTNLSIEGTGFSVTDVDAASSGAVASLNVGEGAITVVAGDSGVVIAGGNGTGTVSLSGMIAQVNNLLTGLGTGTITYLNGSNTPSTSTTLTVTVDDQGNTGAGGSLSDSAAVVINIGAVNDSPQLDLDANNSSGQAGADFVTTFTEDAGPVAIADTDASLSDLDNATLASLQVILTNQFDGTAEVLAADTTGTSIAASYSAGTLILSGVDSVANYQQVLRTVTYENTSQNPNTTPRAIEFLANDGAATSNLATATVTVVRQNDQPVATTESYDVDNDGVLTVAAPGLLANDSDVDTDSLTAVLINGPATGVLSFNADGSFTYTPDLNFSGTTSFTYAASDGTVNSAPTTVSIDVIPTAAPPIDPNPEPDPEPERGPAPPPAGDPDDEPSGNDDSDESSEDTNDTTGESGEEGNAERPGSGPPVSSTDSELAAASAELTFALLDVNDDAANRVIHEAFRAGSAKTGVRSIPTTSSLAISQQFGSVDLASQYVGFELSTLKSGLLWQQLDTLQKQLESESTRHNHIAGTATVVTAAVSTGYVIWALRGSFLLASFLSTIPAWRTLDPLPILEGDSTSGNEDDESLADIASSRSKLAQEDATQSDSREETSVSG